MDLGGGAVTTGKKQRVLIIPPPSQPGYFTDSKAPPRVEKEVLIAPTRVRMAPSRVNVKATITVTPARYTRLVKASTSTTTGNIPAKNTPVARS